MRLHAAFQRFYETEVEAQPQDVDLDSREHFFHDAQHGGHGLLVHLGLDDVGELVIIGVDVGVG